MKVEASILTMYAVTPCHAGSGSTVGIVDSPIQRERHTNWPVIASSGVKGAMRAHFDKFKYKIQNQVEEKTFKYITEKCFGNETIKNPDTNETYEGHAGSLSVSDMKILAFPMRSNIAPFVWITCPAVLNRLIKDLKLTGKNEPCDKFIINKDDEAWKWNWTGEMEADILLEDMEVKVNYVGRTLEKILEPYFKAADRLLVVSDKVFVYGVSQCTSITAQIKIDQATGTTANGSLRSQEELPTDTIMYCVIFWGDSRSIEENMKMETIKKYMTKEVMKDFIQVGGDETCGRGIFELDWNEDKGGAE